MVDVDEDIKEIIRRIEYIIEKIKSNLMSQSICWFK
jgi:hypothetical protein